MVVLATPDRRGTSSTLTPRRPLSVNSSSVTLTLERRAKQLIARLFSTTLPCELGTSATFDFASLNRRALTKDVMDVTLTPATNAALSDGVAPVQGRTRSQFPYFGEPYTSAGQASVTRARPGVKKER
jgi:hypothetical protein